MSQSPTVDPPTRSVVPKQPSCHLVSASQSESLDQVQLSLQLLIDHERLQASDLGEANQQRPWQKQIEKLSVLLPVKNQQWSIERLLNQILTQSLTIQCEVIVVDDHSTDQTSAVVQRIAQSDRRVRLVRMDHASGRCAALLAAIEQMSGDVAIVADTSNGYDHGDYQPLLQPIIRGDADAVFGSRYTRNCRRIGSFWNALGDRFSTVCSNAINDLNLTDLCAAHKAVRADILRELRFSAAHGSFETQLATRLAQWDARIDEVPITWHPTANGTGTNKRRVFRTVLSTLATLLKCRLSDNRFTRHTGMYVLRSVAKAQNYNRWLADQVRPFLGARIAEAGAGIGNMSCWISECQHLLLVDHDPVYIRTLKDKYQSRSNVHVRHCDLIEPDFESQWIDDRLDTVFCSNVLEHLGPDRQILQSFSNALQPGGHCIIIVPAEPVLYNGLDVSLGHYRRYQASQLADLMQQAGLDVVYQSQVCKLGAIAWFVNGTLLRRRRLTPRQMRVFDRLWPLMKMFDRWLPWRGMSLIMVGQKPHSNRPADRSTRQQLP